MTPPNTTGAQALSDALRAFVDIKPLGYGAPGTRDMDMAQWNEAHRAATVCIEALDGREQAGAVAELARLVLEDPKWPGSWANGDVSECCDCSVNCENEHHPECSIRSDWARAARMKELATVLAATGAAIAAREQVAPAKWCAHCRKDNHSDSECWSTRAIGVHDAHPAALHMPTSFAWPKEISALSHDEAPAASVTKVVRGTAVEVCPICDIAGCSHIRNRKTT